MAIYFKFKSEKNYDSVSVKEPFISVSAFKQRVYELKYKGKKNAGLCLGNDFDITVINAQTNDCYDDNMLIPSHTKVLIKRVPGGRRCRFIDTRAIVIPGSHIPKSSASNSTISAHTTSNSNGSHIPKSSASNSTISAPTTTNSNGSPIPKSSTSNSTITSSSSCGNNPDDRKNREEAITSNKYCSSPKILPLELLCPLCKGPMEDATFTKCCYNSFCDQCIRDHLILSTFSCVCGANDMLNDYLIPNITVRRLIHSMLQSGFTIPQPRKGEKKRKRVSSGNVETETS